MTPAIIEGLAALYLLFMASVMSTKDIPSGFFFRFLPICLGVPLAFLVTARVMGWPI